MPRPTSVEPVNATFATSGCSTSRCPQTLPGPATTFSTPSGRPASSAIFSSSSAVSGVSSAGLSTIVLPAASAGRHLPRGDHQREVPRHDQAHHAERLAEGHVHAAGHRDRVAEQPLGRAGVVAEGLDHHAHLAAGVADRLAGVARLEHGQVLGALLERVGQPAQQRRAVGGVHRAPGRERGLGAPPPRRRSPPRPRAGPRPSPARWRARRPRSRGRLRPLAASTSASTTLALHVLLGMPEHAEREPAAGQLDRLDACRPRAQPVTTRPSPSSADALVVVRLHRHRVRPRGAVRPASRAPGARRGRRTCPACGGGPRGPGCRAGAGRASRRRPR